MRSLLILLLAGALALGGYLTRPSEAQHEANARKLLADQRSGGDIGDLIRDRVLDAAGNDGDRFEDMFVATKYVVSRDDKVMLDCLGLYGQFLCSQPGKK
jgi:hypothetical protein